jgi:hypothetical protein
MARPMTYLPIETIARADRLRFDGQVEQDVSSLGFMHQAEQDISALGALPSLSLGRPGTSTGSPVAMPSISSPVEDDTSTIHLTRSAPLAVPESEPTAPEPSSYGASPGDVPTGGTVAPAQPSAPATGAGATGATASTPAFGQDERSQKQARVYQAVLGAGRSDEDARILTAVTETEGGLMGAVGDNGQSVGPFQFHERGELPGFAAWLKRQGIATDPRVAANDPDLATRYAATTYLGQAIDRGRALGLSGAELATYVQRTGQRSVAPERTGENYTRLFGQGAPSAPVQAPSPTQRASESRAQSAEQTPQAQAQYAPGSYTPNQINAATSEGLDYETALAVCGPAAAIAFARKTGRNPTMQEAVSLAREAGWTAGAGMAGPASEQRLLQSMGVAARLVDGSPEWQAVAADVQRGNPVIVSTPGHYFVAERYNPADGTFDFGQSVAVLKASGGRTWFKPEELAGLGMGTPRASLFLDSPTSPSPSVVAGSSAPQAQAQPAPDATMYRASLTQPQQEPVPGTGDAVDRTVGMPDEGGYRNPALDVPYDYGAGQPGAPDQRIDPFLQQPSPAPPWDRNGANDPNAMYRQPLGQPSVQGPPVRDDYATNPGDQQSATPAFLPGDGGTAPEPAGQRPYDPDQGPHELPPPDLTPTAAPAPVWTPGQPLPADLGLSPTQGPPAPTHGIPARRGERGAAGPAVAQARLGRGRQYGRLRPGERRPGHPRRRWPIPGGEGSGQRLRPRAGRHHQRPRQQRRLSPAR